MTTRRSCSRPATSPRQLEAFAALRGVLPNKPRRGARQEHARLPAIRADPFCVARARRFLAGHGTWVAPDALALLQDVREQHARAAGLVELSAATDAVLEVPGLGGELKPFQRAGVSYLLAQRAPSSPMSRGWARRSRRSPRSRPTAPTRRSSSAREPQAQLAARARHWLPGRSARRCRYRAARGASTPPADITVVNYDILSARLDELRRPETTRARARRVPLLQERRREAHPGRTAARRAVPRDGLVLALTGTPVMNRPPELIAQLRIIGRLGDFGSGAQFGRRFRGPDAHLRLHWHLRARCSRGA